MVLLSLQVCTAQPDFCCAGDGIQGFVLDSQALYDLQQQDLAMRHHTLSKNKEPVTHREDTVETCAEA